MAKTEVKEYLEKEILLRDKYRPFRFTTHILTSLYLLILGILALYVGQGFLTWSNFIAIGFILGAVFVAVFGGLEVLHISFVKRRL
ncbi:MAG: hypothetical protein ACP5HJ_02640 [Candidatus Micrarchaeia archaeon]